MTIHKKSVYDIFYKVKKSQVSLSYKEHLIYFLYKIKRISSSSVWQRLIGKLIYELEDLSCLNELPIDEKIIESYDCNIKVKSLYDYNTITRVFRTRPYDVWRLKLDDGLYLDAADTHLVFTSINLYRKLCELKPGDRVLTKYGYRYVISVENLKYKACMIDFSIEESHHSYFSNDILSHNTTTTVAYMVWYMIFKNDKNISLVANKGKTSSEIVTKFKQVVEGLPFYMKPGIVRQGATSITLENGCYLNSATTNPTSITGQSTTLLYLDEAAHIPENIVTEFWRSIFPTLSSFKSCQFIVTSTPKGTQNLFYRLYDGACKQKNSFKPYRVDWWQVPGRDEKWEAEMRKDFGDENFDQEFGLQFDVQSSKLVRTKDIKFMERIKKEFVNIDIDGLDKKISDRIYWDPSFNPGMLSNDDLNYRRFLFIVDTAEGKEIGERGKEDPDSNVINIFEVEPLSPIKIKKNRSFIKSINMKDCLQFKQIGLYIDNESDEEESAIALRTLIFDIFKNGKRHNGYEESIDNSRILIEMNFNGKNFVNIFKDHPMYYEEVFIKTYHTKPIPGEKPPLKKIGFLTKGGEKGKKYFCELGAKLIAKRQILVRQYNNNVNKSSIGQIQAFGKNKKGSYEGSCVHDDISVTILFVSIAVESEEFIWWIEDWIDNLQQWQVNEDHWNKILNIKKLLSLYIQSDEEDELTDEEFKDLYMN